MTDWVDEIKERAKKGTTGPWKVQMDTYPRKDGNGQLVTMNVCTEWIHGQLHTPILIAYLMSSPFFQGENHFVTMNPDDAWFIAHAKQDIPRLVAEVERLERINNKLSKENAKMGRQIAAIAEWAYQSEVVETGMEELTIGPGMEFADKADWIEYWLSQWEDEGE